MWKSVLQLLISLYFLIQCYTASATITVPNRRKVETFSIYDPIKMEQKFSPITGIIFPIKFERNGLCEVRPRKPESFGRKNTTIPLDNPAFIIMENEAGAAYTGCKSFEDLENAIFRYSDWLVKRGYFPIKAMIVKHWSLNQYFSDMNTVPWAISSTNHRPIVFQLLLRNMDRINESNIL
ncbi:hypothetical protein BDF22DRAFT_440638 [Syncephalis plumigaleata]|nr:hypothetical protein BDF22DRAFT_440638 [Syncephalis plumigaleata]